MNARVRELYARLTRSFRRPRVLRPEPLGTLVADGVSFAVREITLADGGFAVRADMTMIPGGWGVWNPTTYELRDPAGGLVRAGRVPPGVGPITIPSAMRLMLTVNVAIEPPGAFGAQAFRLPKGLD